MFVSFFALSRISYLTSEPWYDETDTPENNARARKAYSAILTIAPKEQNDEKYIEVFKQVSQVQQQRYFFFAKCVNL